MEMYRFDVRRGLTVVVMYAALGSIQSTIMPQKLTAWED
jgi:hypothetical protein